MAGTVTWEKNACPKDARVDNRREHENPLFCNSSVPRSRRLMTSPNLCPIALLGDRIAISRETIF